MYIWQFIARNLSRMTFWWNASDVLLNWPKLQYFWDRGSTKRARPDIATAVEFLTTRVKASDEDDWKKLTCMIRYLHGSIELPLILRADSVPIPKWWVDGSHATHPNMRGHSGPLVKACLSIHPPNRSSTLEVLPKPNSLLPITNYFLEAQGYGHQDTILYQDNQSAILLEKNGYKSSSKRTKHLNCRFYFITDRINPNDLSVKYCPTKEMVGDFYTNI